MGKWASGHGHHVQDGTTQKKIFCKTSNVSQTSNRLSSCGLYKGLPSHQNILSSLNAFIVLRFFLIIRESVDARSIAGVTYRLLWTLSFRRPYITQTEHAVRCHATPISSTEMKLPRSWMCESTTECQPFSAFTMYFAATGNREGGKV